MQIHRKSKEILFYPDNQRRKSDVEIWSDIRHVHTHVFWTSLLRPWNEQEGCRNLWLSMIWGFTQTLSEIQGLCKDLLVDFQYSKTFQGPSPAYPDFQVLSSTWITLADFQGGFKNSKTSGHPGIIHVRIYETYVLNLRNLTRTEARERQGMEDVFKRERPSLDMSVKVTLRRSIRKLQLKSFSANPTRGRVVHRYESPTL